MVYGLSCHLWFVNCGLLFYGLCYSLRSVVCGLWFVVCLSFLVFGLWIATGCALGFALSFTSSFCCGLRLRGCIMQALVGLHAPICCWKA